MLSEIFEGVPAVNTNDYVWFVTIKDFNPVRLEFIICIMIINIKIFSWFNPIQDGLFRVCSRNGGGGEGGQKGPSLPKICCTNPTVMKLGAVIPYLKEIQKLYESRDTPL